MKTADPETFAARAANEPILKKSANGPLVAKLLGAANSPQEMANVLRVGMGDEGARSALGVQNDLLSYQVDMSTKKVSTLGLNYNGMSLTEQASPWGQRVKAALDDESQRLAQLEANHRVISDRLDGFGMIENMNFNSITTPAAQKARQGFENLRDWTKINVPTKIGALVNTAYALGPGGLIRIAHSYNDIKPSTYIDINSIDSSKQLNANLLEVKGLSQAEREAHVSSYITAPDAMKAITLQNIENSVARTMVDRYNEAKGLTGTPDEISHEVANSLYKQIAENRSAAQQALRQQTFGTIRTADPNNPGLKVAVDQIDGDGGKMVVTPILKSQMANSHVMMDFKLFQKALDANGSFWQKAINTMGPGWERAVGLGDYVNNVWKFGQLFRLGYAPRMLIADDAMSQLARFGAAAGMARGLAGGKYTWQALRRSFMPGNVIEDAMSTRANLQDNIADITSQQADLRRNIAAAAANNDTVAVQHFQQQHDWLSQSLQDAQSALADTDAKVRIGKAWYTRAGGGAGQRAIKQGANTWDAPFAGAQGTLFKDLQAGNTNFANQMGSAADTYLGRLRSMNWDMLDATRHGEKAHMQSWLRVINQQVANDPLAVNYLKNGNANDRLVRWLASPEGLAYKRDFQLAKHLPNDQLVDRVTSQIDEWLNPAFPGGEAIRRAAASGEVTEDMLKGVPVGARPLVNGQALQYARGDHSAMKMLDQFMDGYYKFMAQLPSEALLRNPLFAQRYGVHIRDLMQQSGRAADEVIDGGTQQAIQRAARYRALSDVKKNTFTMDHETKMSHALRQFGSFFGAQQESWNRWARIIGDKPQILPRIAQVYGAPARAGIETTSDGQPIDGQGYYRDPVTGERKLAGYSDRNISIQIPDYLGGKQFKQFFGLDPNAAMKIPMNTFVMVASHGDGPNPVGAGPIVQIAANAAPKFGADNNPDAADLMQHLGILPFGATKMDAQGIITTFMPTWARKALADQGGVGHTYQQTLWNIMQVENYKYQQGMRATEPSWGEIDSRATKQTWLRLLAGVALPISSSTQDPYQFFRDQYATMIKQQQAGMIQNADQAFYDKYGDSAFIFSQSLTKNNSGLQPTTNAVKMSQHYQDLVNKVGPEYAGLIVGLEGEGTYSQGAVYYERNHPVDPASTTTARSFMSAREALDQAKLSQGWQQYKSFTNGLYAQLFQRGLTSFSDSGAEDLDAQRQALVTVLSSPQLPADQLMTAEQALGATEFQPGQNPNAQSIGLELPEGHQLIGTKGEAQGSQNMVANPFYNAQWAQAWDTQDKGMYDRRVAAFKQIVADPELQMKMWNPDGSPGIRSDLAGLTNYLTYRDDLSQALADRKAAGGSSDITSSSNADLKSQWDALVTNLIQQNTKFGDLFARYLSRDMGYDQAVVQQQQALGTIPQFTGNAATQSPTDQFGGV
jgi:hypothetical protein